MPTSSSARHSVAVSCVVMALGIGWLLTTKAIVPGVDWIWVIGLGIVGALILVFAGVDKLTIVVGPFFMIASVLSVLRQTGRLAFETELPLLVIIVGALMLASTLLPLPMPTWMGRRDRASE